jgi:hypothetical protein
MVVAPVVITTQLVRRAVLVVVVPGQVQELMAAVPGIPQQHLQVRETMGVLVQERVAIMVLVVVVVLQVKVLLAQLLLAETEVMGLHQLFPVHQ